MKNSFDEKYNFWKFSTPINWNFKKQKLISSFLDKKSKLELSKERKQIRSLTTKF